MSEEAKFRCFYFGTKLGTHAQDFIADIRDLFVGKVKKYVPIY